MEDATMARFPKREGDIEKWTRKVARARAKAEQAETEAEELTRPPDS